MNERWRTRLNELKQFVPEPLQMEWRQHVTPQWKKHVEEPIKSSIDKRKVASHEHLFNETDEPTLVFEKARNDLLGHLAEVMKGRGGDSQQQAEEITAAHIDIVARSLEFVAADIAANRKHRFDARDPQALIGILTADDALRREGLEKMMPKNMRLYPVNPEIIQCIAYSLVDPGKDSIVDPELEASIKIGTPDRALDLYKGVVEWQVEGALWAKTPNIAEFGDPKAGIKRAALGVGTAAILAMILGSKKA